MTYNVINFFGGNLELLQIKKENIFWLLLNLKILPHFLKNLFKNWTILSNRYVQNNSFVNFLQFTLRKLFISLCLCSNVCLNLYNDINSFNIIFFYSKHVLQHFSVRWCKVRLQQVDLQPRSDRGRRVKTRHQKLESQGR